MNGRRSFLAFVLAISTCFSASAAEKTALKVAVTNQYGKPVDNAAVILDFLGGRNLTKLGKRSKIHWELRTNQHGLATFPPVPEGTVQLQVITKSYQTFGEKVELAGAEKQVEITLNPPQKQYSAHPPLKPADAPKQ